MRKESGELGHQTALEIRRKELSDRSRTVIQRIENFDHNNLAEKLGKETRDAVIKTLVDAGRIQTDLLWVGSMVSAGISPETILKVWDIKDEGSFKTRDKEGK